MSSVVQKQMNCQRCGNLIPEARQIAVPDERLCVDCVKELGDVDPIRGAMIYEHKTGPYLELTGDVEALLRNSRKGVHAQLPMSSKKRAEENQIGTFPSIVQKTEILLEPALTLMARCHPDRPRVSPKGLCLSCSINWYRR